MFALVISDSHGSLSLLEKAIRKNSDCNTIFFLGDGENDIAQAKVRFPEKKFIIVTGNCDFNLGQHTAYNHFEGNTIVSTHGHRYYVKQTLTELLKHGEGVMANACFYGHTHKRDFHYDAGHKMFVLNPGALCLGSYAKIEINKYGIEAEFKSVYDD